MRRALAIVEQYYGAQHPEVAIRLNNLASLLRATNRLAEAEPLYRRGLAIWEQSLGGDHPKIAHALNNLALLLQATNRLAEAEPLMRRMVEVILKFTVATGHQYPYLPMFLDHYAGLLQAMGRDEAEVGQEVNDLLGQIAAKLQQDDPQVLTELVQWVQSQQNAHAPQDPHQQLEALRQQATEKEKTLGPNHAQTVSAIDDLAKHLVSMDAFDEAEAEYRKAVDRAPGHIIVLGNYAFFVQNFRKDFAGAREIYLRALKADPSDAINHTNFAGLCLVMGDTGEMKQHLRESWRLTAGNTDRYTARTLFLRAALAATQSEDSRLYLGQLKTVFDQGIQPMPSRNISVREHLQQNLAADQFALFDAIYAAINDPDALERLSELPAWQAIQPRPLDEPWP